MNKGLRHPCQSSIVIQYCFSEELRPDEEGIVCVTMDEELWTMNKRQRDKANVEEEIYFYVHSSLFIVMGWPDE